MLFPFLWAHPAGLGRHRCREHLWRSSDRQWLLKYVATELSDGMVARGAPPFTLFKTADPLDLNCFGIDQRRSKDAFRGPDTNPTLLKY